jgi:hypothetical protein
MAKRVAAMGEPAGGVGCGDGGEGGPGGGAPVVIGAGFGAAEGAARIRQECDWDPVAVGVPPGQLWISFDVYDAAGNVNLAPHGVRSFTSARTTP